MKQHAAPIVVAIAFLLSFLAIYVGSYCALVSPEVAHWGYASRDSGDYWDGYRNGGDWAWRLFWPIEQIDRKLRPSLWKTHAWESEDLSHDNGGPTSLEVPDHVPAQPTSDPPK